MAMDFTAGTADHVPGARIAAEPTMRQRGAEFPFVQEFLRLNAAVPHRSLAQRVFGADPLVPRTQAAYRGALGEVALAAVLAELGAGWFVLHEIPVGADGSNIDHLVIGPPGVFAIIAKNHSGREVWVSGDVLMVGWERYGHLRQAETAADRAAELLTDALGEKVEVRPCVIVLDSRVLTIAAPASRVVVLTPGRLRPWLAGLRSTLSQHDAALLRMFAEERSTWNEPPSGPGEARERVHRFRQFQDEVSTASRRRFLWATGAIVAAWCTFVASLGGAAVGFVSLVLR